MAADPADDSPPTGDDSPPTGDDPPVRTGDWPTLAARVVGGLQWAITGAYVFLLGFLGVAWYLHLTRTAVSFDASGAFAAFVLAAFVAGYFWVGSRSSRSAPGAHERRIEVVVTMLVLGFLCPFAVLRSFDVLGVGRPVPLFGFGVAYALALALSYGLVYGLGLRFFLGSAPETRE